MNRQIVYPGAIPLETDLLNTNKYTMIALAKLASAIMGSSTYVRGLACTPTSPASMVVNVAAGEIYSLANIDGTAYSSLAADTTHSIMKQGYVLDAQSFTLTAPSTSGYSINYLIQVTYADTDGGSTVLPYYNASNPSTAWSGPNNSGTSQYTVRQGLCTVSLKAGVAATTGTQKTPSPDTGYTGLYVITVAQGATTVTAANIAVYANAPFIPSTGLVDGIQRKVMTYAADTGTANAYAAQYVPALLSVTDGTEVEFKATAANTGASTFNPNGLGASPILTLGGNALTGGEIPAGSQVRVKWNATLSSWLIVSASGITVAQTLANLGLKTAAQRDVGVGLNQIPDMSAWTSGGNSNNGWRRSPDGYIEQWGYTTSVASVIYISFPIPFTTGLISLNEHDNSPNGTARTIWQFGPTSNMGVNAYNIGALITGSTAFNTPVSASCRWFASGR